MLQQDIGQRRLRDSHGPALGARATRMKTEGELPPDRKEVSRRHHWVILAMSLRPMCLHPHIDLLR